MHILMSSQVVPAFKAGVTQLLMTQPRQRPIGLADAHLVKTELKASQASSWPLAATTKAMARSAKIAAYFIVILSFSVYDYEVVKY